jgi:hypothetical protein
MKYAIEQRLRFIDFLLSEYGTINRSALMDYFGISTPQASLDFAAYQKLATSNMLYDASARTYRRTPDFKRYWE